MRIYHIEDLFEGTAEKLDDNFGIDPDYAPYFAEEHNCRFKIVDVPSDYYKNEAEYNAQGISTAFTDEDE